MLYWTEGPAGPGAEATRRPASHERSIPFIGYGLPREVFMAQLQLTITAEEREYLVSHLEAVLKDTRVEEHRTRTPSYRQYVLRQEDLIVSLLNKLGKPPQ